MSLSIRLEKLHFLVVELRLAFYLTKFAPDSFIARTLARHIAVRAENFITHARALKKPLMQAGFNTKAFHIAKEVYANSFDEYFHLVRDRLGAHVQDIDFSKRIQLWNDIEIVKIEYFVDGAREIYEALACLNIPDYIKLTVTVELTDSVLEDKLNSFSKSNIASHWAEIGFDPLSMTRQNTMSVLNAHPIHERAGQLVLIRRWIKVQRDLLARVNGYESIERILRSRIITDIVSFYDCLITRSISQNSKQYMHGLNTLLNNANHSVELIDHFLKVFPEDRIQEARVIRDQMGGHLENNEAISLTKIRDEIDKFGIQDCLSFFEKLESVFDKVCHNILFLRMYVADGQRLYGVSPNSLSVILYDDKRSNSVMTTPPSMNFSDDQVYRDNLEIWTDGIEPACGEARYFFYQAFMQSPIVEQIIEIEGQCSGSRRIQHDFRKAHAFILDVLQSSPSEIKFNRTLELLLSCSSGAPYALAEILVRYGQSSSQEHNHLISHCFGDLARWSHKSVRDYLQSQYSQRHDWDSFFCSILALFKIYVRTEGLARTNKKISALSFEKDIAPLVSGLPSDEKLIFMIAFASQFCNNNISSYSKVFTDEYNYYQLQIELLCKDNFLGPMDSPSFSLLDGLLQTHDYSGVCLLLANCLHSANCNALANIFLRNVCRGLIVTPQHEQGRRHQAICFLEYGEYAMASDLAHQLAIQNPENVSLQIFVAQILAATPGAEKVAVERASMIRAEYNLSKTEEDCLSQITN